ncbi:MAG: hypothetical protein IE933_14915 [Sphingomonadales bacterium]|nr:hypothetical protein [Sphingomonadales bacterium]
MRRQLVERELTSEGPRRKGGARGKRRTVTVNLAESPLSWLHARGHLSDRLFDAGERLRADYERAQLGANVTMRWDAVRIRGQGGDTEAEKALDWPARSGKLVLKLALERVAEFYRVG